MRKTVAILLFLTAGALVASGCDGGEEEVDDSDPNEFCDVGFCADSDVLRNLCVVAFNTCIAGSDTNDDDCRLAARFICETDVGG